MSAPPTTPAQSKTEAVRKTGDRVVEGVPHQVAFPLLLALKRPNLALRDRQPNMAKIPRQRLGEIVIGPRRECLFKAFSPVHAGREQNHGLGGLRHESHLATQFHAVHVRKHDVEDHERERVALVLPEAFRRRPVSSHLVPPALKDARQQHPLVFVILYDKGLKQILGHQSGDAAR